MSILARNLEILSYYMQLHIFRLDFLYHACHVYRVLEPLENCASLSLIAFANSKDSGEPVLKRNQSLFCYNAQSMEVHVDQGSSQTLHF